jgi:ubiquinone/menaquinone biosynthesis C-methylase UbiE
MTESFDRIQQEFYQSAEVKRFKWQTTNPYIVEKELLLLRPLAELIDPEDIILESGCGEGANIIHLRKCGIHNHITAVDFSPEKVRFCQQLEIENTDFIKADTRQLPFEDNAFTFTYVRDLLHHVNENRKELIDELLRVTKPGGKLVIIEGNGQKPTNYVFATLFKHEKGMKDSTHKKFLSLLDPYNYEITAYEPCNFFRLVLHYNFGRPGWQKYGLVRRFLSLLENFVKNYIPKTYWAYWFILIKKEAG